MSTPILHPVSTQRKPPPVPLDARGVSLATSCLSRELYRLLGEFIDRRDCYQIAVLMLQEYARGEKGGVE